MGESPFSRGSKLGSSNIPAGLEQPPEDQFQLSGVLATTERPQPLPVETAASEERPLESRDPWEN